MLCTFELNIILQNRTTFVKSLQGRTRCEARSFHPLTPHSTCLGIISRPSRLWACHLFHLLSFCSEQKLRTLCLCLSLHSVENFAWLNLFLVNQNLRVYLLISYLSWQTLGKLASWSLALYFLSQIPKGKADIRRAFHHPKLPFYFFKEHCQIFPRLL